MGVGIAKLFDASQTWSGLWLIAVGLWLQAAHLQWHGVTYGNSWPLLLMVLGAGIVLKTFFIPRTPRRNREDHHDDRSHGTQN